MKTDFLKKKGIKFEYNDKVQKLINASGDEMKCAGEIVLYLFANDRICPVNALISDDSIHDLIISWHDLITHSRWTRFPPRSLMQPRRVNESMTTIFATRLQ